jgi:hypothetical protein
MCNRVQKLAIACNRGTCMCSRVQEVASVCSPVIGREGFTHLHSQGGDCADVRCSRLAHYFGLSNKPRISSSINITKPAAGKSSASMNDRSGFTVPP